MCDFNKISTFNKINHKNKSFNSYISLYLIKVVCTRIRYIFYIPNNYIHIDFYLNKQDKNVLIIMKVELKFYCLCAVTLFMYFYFYLFFDFSAFLAILQFMILLYF